ncbi:MAG: DUF3891 family protein [Candidatus Dormibacteraeota bacterium]|nr:DUF3891 family protein [Candidatus Dormibacteraeota bacterium]
MIVREAGDHLVLVRQADHALFSGELAAAWGRPPWQPPEPFPGVVVGARLHDLAWMAHDEALPTRPDGRPFAFSEVQRLTSVGFYGRGLDAVQAIEPYAGLLASLHYSGFYHSHWGWLHWAPNTGLEGEEKAQVERFVAQELGRQERLQAVLGGDDDAFERRLSCNYRWLQLWDRISLDICRYGFEGFEVTHPAMPAAYAPDAPEVSLRLRLAAGGACLLDPYPLTAEPYRVRIRCVRLPLALCTPGRGEELRRAWAAAGDDGIDVTLRAG